MYTLPTLNTDNASIDLVYRIALGDIYSNVVSFRDGLLKSQSPVLLAGAGYHTPWMRDAAINIWNGCGLIIPEVSKNSLLATIAEKDGVKRFGGEYWDAVIWAVGAEWYYKYTGDKEFLPLMTEVIENSLTYFEDTEFDENLNLFRGPACYGDGISAYPDRYATGESGIARVADLKTDICLEKGVGIPMYTLSTNCLYYECYNIARRLTGKEKYKQKAENMKAAVNRHFWNGKTGRYNYIIDAWGGCDYSEGIGQSFAILFGIADKAKAESVIAGQPITENGIPCIDRKFPRYEGRDGIPRHAETVWPQIQAFWADAVSRYDVKKFEYEFSALTKNVARLGYFAEVLHPVTGERYGGIQEWQGNYVEWASEVRQTWSATGYLRMVLFDLFGMRFEREGLYIKPLKNSLAAKMELRGLRYRNADLDVFVTGENYGKEVFISANISGKKQIIV